MQTNDDVQPVRAGMPWTILPVAGLALLADGLFHDNTAAAGWTAGLFAVALLATVVVMRGGGRVDWRGGLAAALTLGQALALIDQPTLLRLLLFAGGLLATVLLVSSGGRRGLTALIGASGRFVGDSVRRTLYAPLLLVQTVGDRATATSAARPVSRLANWTLPGLAAVVFGSLILGANPVLEQLFDTARVSVGEIDLSAGRLAVLVLVAWAVWLLLTTPVRTVSPRGLCHPLRSSPPGADAVPTVAVPAGSARRSLAAWMLGPTAVLRSLAVCNCLFLAQTGTDLAFLWAEARLPAGLTYAEYTHQGAALLMVMAVLAGGFALLAGHTGPVTRQPGGAATRQWIRRLVVLWLVQTLFVVASAIERLVLYIDAYMLTHLRLAALIWMGLVVVGLMLVLVRSLTGRPIRWLVNANLSALLVTVYAISCVDTGRIIADYNVDNRAAAARFDPDYLRRLGPSALPAIQRYIEDRKQVDPFAHPDYWSGFLRRKAGDLARVQSDWRGWTWRQQRLLAALTADRPD